MKNRFVNYGAVLLIIAAVSAGILAMVNDFTKTVIRDNEIAAVNSARKNVLSSAETFKEAEVINAGGLEFIPGFNTAGELTGYVVSVSENGYAGAINFVLGIEKDGKIAGLDIIGSQETPGLGAKIMDKPWQAIWAGRDSSYVFNKSTDAFAGATISPTAVYTGMMRALTVYDKEVRK
ncbi:RnfABCDGE type electron transport complex subunit G [Fusobacterium sp.]|uniref:RnfABCDGE type electron transport complex subunit G n=1 Tax=Fusobacterium sp. TaxID=68766 RepID=UPI002902F224|nr:RnfABCDGE type electron transport complex subunit G [Fusobacterium sp.]MDU1910333.1 RnfABCDGE type electron transport complex subunit G [Fusobacterium sp.]